MPKTLRKSLLEFRVDRYYGYDANPKVKAENQINYSYVVGQNARDETTFRRRVLPAPVACSCRQSSSSFLSVTFSAHLAMLSSIGIRTQTTCHRIQQAGVPAWRNSATQ